MAQLERRDQIHLEAAKGWLGLGSWLEANWELDCISPRLRAHPDVLSVRWIICSKADNWELALEVARTLAEADPEDSFGAVRLGWTLDALNRVQEAYDLLTAVAPRFPDDYRLHYDLARYACKLGKLKEALQSLESAFNCPATDDLRGKALDDPALEPLWENISVI